MNAYTEIALHRKQDVLFVMLNRPETRNALGSDMVQELTHVLKQAQADRSIRALVLRGRGRFFCAGGNIGNFQARLDSQDDGDPVADRNRDFGVFMEKVASTSFPVVAVVEGAAMGGGMGLACVADIVIAAQSARFALSETTLGIIPAQILPFVVGRIGQAATRKLGLTGVRVSGDEAYHLGLVDYVAEQAHDLDLLLAQCLTQIGMCAPHANRELKELVRSASVYTEAQMLDIAAKRFSSCMRDEGVEGIAAFREKRTPAWNIKFSVADVQDAFDCTEDMPS